MGANISTSVFIDSTVFKKKIAVLVNSSIMYIALTMAAK